MLVTLVATDTMVCLAQFRDAAVVADQEGTTGFAVVLSGMTYMEHLQDNIRTYSPLIPLTDEDKDFLEETAQLMIKYPTIPCNDCKYCMPCPYAIDIPAVLLHYNKCVNEGNVPKSRTDENYREARRAFLVGYDRSVPKLRQATFKRHMKIARGLLSEDDYLLTEILFNPRTPKQISRIQEELNILQDIIKDKDSEAMKGYLTKIRKNIE